MLQEWRWSHEALTGPKAHQTEQCGWKPSTRGRLVLMSCRSGTAMARRVSSHYDELLTETGRREAPRLLADVDRQFADTETCARLDEDVTDADVFLVQALCDPTSPRKVDENLMALLAAARTATEWGAAHVTAVLPYLAYARQDKPTRFQREPTTLGLVACLMRCAGIERVVTWHPHSPQARALFGSVMLQALDPLGFFVDTFQHLDGRPDVAVIAPDAGAAPLASSLAQALKLRSGIALKHRPRPGQAEVAEIVGDLSGKRTALVVDDMIASGGTVEAVIHELVWRHGVEEVHLAASHNLGSDKALERLTRLHEHEGLASVTVTDSVPQRHAFAALPFARVHSLAGRLAVAVNAMHYGRGISEVFSTGPLPMLSDDVDV